MLGLGWTCTIENDVPTLLCLGEVLGRVVTVLLMFSGAVSVLFMIWGAIRFILAAGDPKGLAQAKNMFTYSLAGLIIIILSFALIMFFGDLLGVEPLSTLQFDFGN